MRCLLLALVITTFSWAQDISTDRPDYTESTTTVPRGAIQIETGIQLSRHHLEAGSSNYLGGPFPLVRIGLSHKLEFRVGADGFASESQGKEHHTGMSDFEAGIKLRLRDETEGGMPALAIIAAASIPAGSTYFSSSRIDPILGLCWSKSLPHEFDVAGYFNFKRLIAANKTESAVTLTLGRELGHGYSTFAELYRIAPIEEDEPAHWIFDSGIAKVINKNIQLDASVGHTLQARTPYWYAGLGFSIRLPK